MISKKLYNECISSLTETSLVTLKDPRLVRISSFGENNSMSVHDSMIFTESHHNSKINIGKYVSIATGCIFLLGGNHNYRNVTTYLPFGNNQDINKNHIHTKGDINIGNDVWIGMNCIIMSGVKIGTGSVIAAGSIVSSDIAPYTIVAGNPATSIKKRFSEEIIKDLIESRWWDLTIEDLLTNKHLFSENVENFINSIKK